MIFFKDTTEGACIMKFGVLWFLHLDKILQCFKFFLIPLFVIGFVTPIDSKIFLVSWCLFGICALISIVVFAIRPPSNAKMEDFISKYQEEFREKVAADAFVEWEEVYNGTCYGTLKSEMERIWAKGNIIIFDVDVMGGINLKRIFGEQACSIFIMPPSIDVLRERLIGRGTDSMETIEKRVAKAEFEISKAPEFDHVVVNDILDTAVAETESIINDFLAK